ncbi:uncharacterized protein LOC107484398 [Arachis duranensis]|uniref:Uncharacterized protein LOC107484398 n=1 Tax=Arachis duranensis TaxID=130453 RepID=A0A6P4D0U6_ARADU|nr:uncharacterized protein LOC107484398 [Arachis duranensis]
MARQDATMRNLKRQAGQLPRQLAKRPTNAFPSDTIPNPREECKDVQLRSGKIVGEYIKDINKEAKKPREDDKIDYKNDKEAQPSKKGKEVMKKLEISIPLAEALEQMPLYAKFLKELISKKRSWQEKETVVLTQECSAIIQKGLPPKLKDPGSFLIPCTIGNMAIDKALCDLGASINLMPLFMMKKLMIEEVKPIRMSLQLADISLKIPNEVVENLLVKVGKFIFPSDFVILNMDEEGNNSIILGRPFLATARVIIDVEKGKMVLRVHEEQMVINVFKAMQYPIEKENCMRIDMVDTLVEEELEVE